MPNVFLAIASCSGRTGLFTTNFCMYSQQNQLNIYTAVIFKSLLQHAVFHPLCMQCQPPAADVGAWCQLRTLVYMHLVSSIQGPASHVGDDLPLVTDPSLLLHVHHPPPQFNCSNVYIYTYIILMYVGLASHIWNICIYIYIHQHHILGTKNAIYL